MRYGPSFSSAAWAGTFALESPGLTTLATSVVTVPSGVYTYVVDLDASAGSSMTLSLNGGAAIAFASPWTRSQLLAFIRAPFVGTPAPGWGPYSNSNTPGYSDNLPSGAIIRNVVIELRP